MVPSRNALLRTLGVAVALQITAHAPAWACDGQVGKVIFEDNFADNLGGWGNEEPTISIKPPELLIALDKKHLGHSIQNFTFFATDGDYCIETILPPATAAGGAKGVGIEFFATDYDNFLEAELGADSSVYMSSKESGQWNDLFHVTPVAAFKAGDVNALRVVAKNGLITVYVNGTQVRAIRAQVPTGKLHFGIFGEFLDNSKAVDGSPPIRVKSFKVTAGE